MAGFDIPVMIAVAFACLPFFAPGFTIPRWQGVLFLLYYVAYTVYLVLGQTDRDAKERYAAAMLKFVIPLTLLTLAVVAVRVLAKRNGAKPA
jgi:cation:H+ antiporter